MKQAPYWGFTNIGHHHTKCGHQGNLVALICAPLLYALYNLSGDLIITCKSSALKSWCFLLEVLRIIGPCPCVLEESHVHVFSHLSGNCFVMYSCASFAYSDSILCSGLSKDKVFYWTKYCGNFFWETCNFLNVSLWNEIKYTVISWHICHDSVCRNCMSHNCYAALRNSLLLLLSFWVTWSGKHYCSV